jgi:small subunit ribosomal protein S16
MWADFVSRRTLSTGAARIQRDASRAPTGGRRSPPPQTSQGDTTPVAVKIRLKRMGKIRAPYYRIVVADSRTKRDGRVIEEIGKYHPKEDPSFIEVDSERAQYWLGVGAQPSEPVAAILKVTGDWQKFKGEPAPAPMKVAEPKRDKTEIFNEALKDSQGEPKSEAVTAKKTAAKKAAPAKPAADEAAPVEATPEEAKAVSDAEAAGGADTAAVDDAVAEAATPIAETAAVTSETAAQGAAEGDAPEGAPADESAAEAGDEKPGA